MGMGHYLDRMLRIGHIVWGCPRLFPCFLFAISLLSVPVPCADCRADPNEWYPHYGDVIWGIGPRSAQTSS